MERALANSSGSSGSARVSAIEKQAVHLYRKAMEAVKHPVRIEILALLAAKPGAKLSFSELRDAFPKMNNASLSHHLRVLQMADLVARTVRLEERYKNPNPYYCFYSITALGEYMLRQSRSVMEGVARFGIVT